MPAPVRLVEGEQSRDWLVCALGVTLTAAALGHFYAHQDGAALVTTATLLPAVAVFAYGAWFWLVGPDAARGQAVLAWAAGGAGLVLAFDLWAITVNAYGAATHTSHVFIQHTSIGALGAAIAGTYSERNRHNTRSHERLQHALDAAMDGVAILDTDGCIAYANNAFCDDYGADGQGAVVGTHWATYFPSDAEAQLADVFESFAEGSSDYWHGRVVARRVDGKQYPQEVSITALGAEGCVWVSRDVTDREERDQRLRVLNRVLRHNVRNSLNVVLGHANRLDARVDGNDDPEQIVDAAEELLAVSEKARVVENVLDNENPTTANLGAVVAGEVERTRSNNPDVDFETSIDADVDVDARIRLAVRELLVNAVKHNDTDDPHVTVAASDSDDPVFRVSDNRSAIPEHEHRALEGVEEAPLRHGPGIGLWVVYWLTRQCGAIVDTDGDATIVVRLPSAEDDTG